MSGAGETYADTQQQNPGPLAIVAIGGARGVVPACLALLGGLPARTGMALVLVLPLAVEEAGRVADSLAGLASVPVLLAQEDAALLPDHAYIVRAEAPMLVRGGRLQGAGHPVAQPFDALLCSLAETGNPPGIAIVLSGDGRDGADGVMALRRRGGQVMVQAPTDAAYPEMPANAIATGQADQVLPAAALGAALALSAARMRREPPPPPASPEDAVAEVVQALRVPAAVLDSRGRVAGANAGFDTLFRSASARGAPDYEALGRAMRAAPLLGAFVAAASQRGQDGGDAALADCIVEVATAARGARVLRLSGRRLRHDPPRILLEAEDMTERTRLAARLEMARAVAEQSERDQARTLAAISHELRQPLQSMSMLHGLLATKAQDPAVHALIGRLDETIDTVSGILDSLLGGARCRAAHPAMTAARVAGPEQTTLQALFDELEAEFGTALRAAGHSWRVVPTGALVSSNIPNLRRILRDRMQLALKAPVPVRILLGCRHIPGAVRIEIWQRGIGSAALPGFCFSVEVPLAPAAGRAQSGAGILVIEDDPEVADGLVRLLRQHGHAVMLARDGGDAMAMAADNPPALVITDFNLPGAFNGIEVVLQLRQLAALPPPAIILTGDTTAETRQEIGLLDAEHARKPIRTEDLLERVRRLLPDAASDAGAEAPPPALTSALARPVQAKPEQSAAADEAPDMADAAAAATEADSEPGSGSGAGGEFWVEAGAEAPKALGQVFIVDDDASLRRDVGEWLSANGWQVESFASASDFLQRDHPDRQGCVLVDAVMPGMGGLELLAALHDRASRLPAIMVTGHGDVRMAVRAMVAGAMDFIEKPIRRSELLRSICNGQARITNAVGEAAVRAEVAARLARLTARQREILDRVIAGSPSKVIAAELNLNQRTVENHRAAIMGKLNVRSLPELIRKVVSAGGGAGSES